MRSKRLLTMLLAIAMIISVMSPAVSAVKPGENTVMNPADSTESSTATKNEASAYDNSLVISQDSASQGLNNLRDDPKLDVYVQEAEAEQGEGAWTATKVDKDLNLTVSEVPECIEELKEAAEYYEKDEKVVAFVVMEQAPLAESYTSITKVAPTTASSMLAVQNEVIEEIEEDVLAGDELEVRYQFTYLTNSFSIETEFGNLEEIAMMDGVKSVFIMPVYDPCTVDTMDPQTSSSAGMTGVTQVWQELAYTGSGMKIAVIDTGLDLDHPSFAADPELTENSMTVEDIEAVLKDLNAYDLRGSITAETLYRSTKVPFAFNYVDSSLTADHSSDNQGDHGTHVAGIAAANATEGTTVVGMAPDAQIIVMKVFGANGGAYTDDIVAALEDAMTLGCDVVNASLGSPNGFSSTDTEIDLIYERLASQDIIATFSAGNEGTSSDDNMWGTDLNRTQNPENSTVGSPSTYVNSFSIASAENSEVMTSYFTLADGTQVFYQDSVEYLYGYTTSCLAELAELELEYVIVPNLGAVEDFYDAEGNSIVEGKIAVIYRGTLSFAEKAFNAQDAGAAAVLIWDNQSEDIFTFGMTTESEELGIPYIPCALVSLEDGTLMSEAENKTLTVSAEQGPRKCAGGQMSSFSSWGAASDLSLVPDITGVGGNVYSCYDGGVYGLMSGTSMSAPQIAGVSALVMEYLYTVYPDAPDGSVRELAMALMMSTADPIISTESGVEASPRQQGAGLVDAYEAVTSEAYLTVGGNRPKVELGDSSTGKYTFSFEIHNFSDEAKTYTLDASLLTEYVTGYQLSETEVEYFMAGVDVPLSGSVTFSKDEVTVPAGGNASVKVTIALSDDDKAYFQQAWENGGYVEGYVYLTNEEGAVELNLPYMGFYGDWTEAPVFDTAYWYDNSFWGVAPADGLPEGDQYYHVFWTSLAGTDWVLGMNPYSGAYADAYGNIAYDPAHNVLSPNGDGVLDGIEEIYLSLLRNAKTLTFTYTAEGQVLHQETVYNNPKTMYISAYGQVVPWIYSWYGSDMYDFKGVESGTEILLTIDATVDYGLGGDHSIQIPITIDTVAPELVYTYEIAQNGNYYLVVEAADETALASVVLMNPAGTQIYAQGYDVQMDVTEYGTMLAYFDITGLGTEFLVAVCDYACNESYYMVEYSAADGNLPEVDTDALYAYRVFDDAIYSDHMYGWVSLNKPASSEETANISVWTDDYLEYAAINAAEYVDGKIFAVDAVYNLVVMDPGLFNRTTVCNLGVNVLDMTFDDSTDTMYVLSKQGNYMYLYTMDLLTGELTELKSYGYYTSNTPWAIADDDNGTIYAIKYNSNAIYTLDVAGGTYAMSAVAVTDEEGNETNLALMDSTGTKAQPNYAQGLTYNNGKLYWAYFRNYYDYYLYADLFTIDTSDWTYYVSNYRAQAYDANNNLVTYQPYAELVGLLTLTETDYTIPEATEMTDLLLSSEELILTVGQKKDVTASPIPWNYEIQSVVWTSSDETVATVAGGRITAVGEGEAVITVTADGFEKSVNVTVVDTDTSFYAYNYYSQDGNYGYVVEVDLGDMNYGPIAASPVDFLAADYNGHDGYYYGYTEGGQFWRVDIATGEAVKLGEPLGYTPVDMAYDYSTGYMYAATTDYNMGYSAVSMVNLNTGALEMLFQLEYQYFITLACDGEGNLYTVTAYGELYQITMEDGYPTDMVMVMDGFGDIQYMQSMCWDHENDVLLWAFCEAGTVMWIDVEQGYALSLGDPTGSGLFEFVGTFTVPETISALPYVAVEGVYAEDMMVMVGGTKSPVISVYPFNATNQTVTLTSGDESVLKINADGTMTGISEGAATVTAVLTDEENVFEVTFQVTVLEGADNVYGMVMTDLATMGGQYWIRIHTQDPSDPDMLAYTDYVIYAEEYYNGKLYAVGYDPNDWSGNWQYFVMDPKTYAVHAQSDLGDGYPFVYDMTYDYTTSTMYALAGPSDNDTDLYVFDVETGALIPLMQPEQFFMSLAAGPDGKLYAMETSKEVIVDEWDPWATAEYTNAMLYEIDPIAGTVELIGDTGVKSNMLASMSYDYDTDRLYWTPLYQGSAYSGGLYIVDTETAQAVSLGSIGQLGAQVSGLYIISDSFPEENPEQLHKLIVAPEKTSVLAGNSVEVSAYMLPLSLDAEVVWTSSNESVATVDGNGVITGVAQGKAEITATVSFDGVTLADSCVVAVLDADAAFLTYNVTDGGWATISRLDGAVTNLTEGAQEVPATAIASTGADVYGYDAELKLFTVNTETGERTAIGQADAYDAVAGYLSAMGYGEEDIAAEADLYTLEIRDLAYDAANDRLLALGAVVDIEWGEMSAGDAIYEVNLEDGTLNELYRIWDYYYVMAMTVDTNGIVYYYNAYNDYYNALDLANGTDVGIVSLQTQSYYGDYESSHSMYYDELTGLIYHLFTQNGSYYMMFTVDPASGVLNLVYENVGEVVYDEDAWAYLGDVFAGMTFITESESEHVCVFGDWETETEASCTEPGLEIRCCECGAYETRELPAHGHNVILVESEDATCELNGYEYHACAYCGGEEYTVILEAKGHNYKNDKCTVCGEKDPDANKGWWGGIFDKWFGGWWGDKDEPSEPTEPSVPETTEPETEPTVPTEPEKPSKPSKPGWGGWFGSFWPFW